MISKETFKNYIGYAIGEIVLVVIGILIALQINAWNEERRNRKLEQDYYCRLLEDVMQDEALLAKLVTENTSRINMSNQMLHLLKQKSPSRKDVVNCMRGATVRTTFTFKPNQAAYEDIKFSGNLNIIRDIKLKTLLINYYSTTLGIANVVDVNSDVTVGMYYRLDKDFVELGWTDLPAVTETIDTALVDLKQFQPLDFPSPELRKRLISEAVFYLGTNARKNELYKAVNEEIQKMKSELLSKCPS
ncbi:MAG: hypothetical protein JST46_17640 [Bacteroidetes bacterium]|nr:hypothetical protein [Bacteroidota bacterium]